MEKCWLCNGEKKILTVEAYRYGIKVGYGLQAGDGRKEEYMICPACGYEETVKKSGEVCAGRGKEKCCSSDVWEALRKQGRV